MPSPMEMHTSEAGIRFRKLAEGKEIDPTSKLHAAYRCSPKTRPELWTIGYGHTSQPGVKVRGWLNGQPYLAEEVVEGLLIDDEEAERLLIIDDQRHADIVRNRIRIPLNQAQFDVCSDMAFQFGAAPFETNADFQILLNGVGVLDDGTRVARSNLDKACIEILRWRDVPPNKGVYRRSIMRALFWQQLPWEWVLSDERIDLNTDFNEVLDIAMDKRPPRPAPTRPERPKFDPYAEDTDLPAILKRTPPPKPEPQPVEDIPLSDYARGQVNKALFADGGAIAAAPISMAAPTRRPAKAAVEPKPPSVFSLDPSQLPAVEMGVKRIEDSQTGLGLMQLAAARALMLLAGTGVFGTAIQKIITEASRDEIISAAVQQGIIFALAAAPGLWLWVRGTWNRDRGRESASQLKI